MAIWF